MPEYHVHLIRHVIEHTNVVVEASNRRDAASAAKLLVIDDGDWFDSSPRRPLVQRVIKKLPEEEKK